MRKYLLLCLSVSFLVTGCANDDNGDSYGSSLHIGSVSINGIITRLGTTLLATEGATISVSALSSGAVSATSQYTYTSGAWSKASGSSWLTPLAGTALCAYYPYSSSITNKAAIPLTSATNVSTNDLSYGYAISVSSTGTSHATFVLQHAYAQLTFSFAGGTGYSGSKVIGDVSISNPGIVSSGSLNITQTPAVYTKVLSGVTFNAGITDIFTTPKASVLMVPTDALSGNISVVIKVGTDYKLLTLPVTYFANSKLEAGTNYQISVNLNATNGNISLGNAAVQTTDWVTGIATNNTVICDAGDQPESNCYIVAPGTTINIPVSRAFTGNATNFSPNDAFTAGLLWSDISADHVKITSIDRYIKVTAGSIPGNSVVYAKNANGDIVWSWHIWVTNYNPGLVANTGANTTTYSYNSNLWMDRSLGATTNTQVTATTLGLLYEWGRKDPFPGSSSATWDVGNNELPLFGEKTSVTKAAVAASPNLINSIQNPSTFYFSGSGNKDWYSVGTGIQNNALWYDGTATKTIYDPCPVGWRVPFYIDNKNPWFELGRGTWNRGCSTSSLGYFPTSGVRLVSSGNLAYAGTAGFFYSANVSGIGAFVLGFDSSNFNVYGSSRAFGCAVRCVQE